MSDLNIQASFNTGEWSPSLNARVDLAKYRSAAALLQNWTVDYRGGASTRPGTRYINQAYKSSTAVRLIPFQASFAVSYVLEFGDFYIRFFNNGSPVLEAATSITVATAGPPEVFTDAAHGYLNGDWIFVGGNYYIVAGATTNTFTLTDLFGNVINTNPFTLPAAAQRVYTLASPFAAADLALVKFAQNTNTLILCHPNYAPQVLTLVTATNWTIVGINFGTSIATPTGLAVASTFAAGSLNYSYTVTAVDAKGQESAAATPVAIALASDIRTVAGTNVVSWTAVPGAVSYNVYEAELNYFGVVPAGAAYGFIGNTNGISFADSNIGPDFSQTPPITQNPFQGAGVQSYTVTANGTYTTVPSVVVAAPPAGGSQATAVASLGVISETIQLGGSGYSLNQICTSFPTDTPGTSVVVQVTGLVGSSVLSVIILVPGSLTSGTTPGNPIRFNGGSVGLPLQLNLVWGVTQVQPIQSGSGYLTAPGVTFGAGIAAATSVLASATGGNPSVPQFFQQRLVLAGPTMSPQQFNMSQTGLYFNYNVNDPVEADNAIQGSLVAGKLQSIKSMAPVASGLMTISDQATWLINGGSNGSAVSPSSIVANIQSYVGASDVPPIVANYDVLFVQSKGSVVRDNAYNIYFNVFTGTDISILSSHLFYGFTILEWAWAEEPFKIVWAVRNDGTMLTLTFLKEQDFVGWTHSITQGSFLSVATVTENTTTAGEVDAIYTVVSRVVQGQTLKYIERVVERTFPNGVVDAWCVDCGIQYVGAPATTFSNAMFLAGLTVTGIADGVVIPPFVMPANGTFTLGTAASKVTVGLGYTCDLQTLAIELGEPTQQGKVKKIPEVDVRVKDTLGLSIGPDFNHLVPMKDLVVGNVSSMLTGQQSQVVTDLVTGDARTVLAPAYTVPGQYCIRQSNPYPASVLGVIPSIVVGDDR